MMGLEGVLRALGVQCWGFRCGFSFRASWLSEQDTPKP